MGTKWNVDAWVRDERYPSGYEYQEVYAGQSLVGAVRAALRAKRDGAGCVKLEWR